jgi:Tc5 transposase DNA-binding domain
LNQEDEKKIVDWINGSIKRGAPRCSLDVIGAANKVLESKLGSQEQPFGRGWLQRFNKRHSLVYRVSEKWNRASANITRANIEGWFENVSSHLNSRPELLEAIQDPRRVCNADETMVQVNSSSSRIIAPEGSGNLFNVVKDDKAGLTVMCTIRADGSVFNSFIIYPYERLPENIRSVKSDGL